MAGYVYVLANWKNGALYLGVTADLIRRLSQHQSKPQGFVARYKLSHLVGTKNMNRLKTLSNVNHR